MYNFVEESEILQETPDVRTSKTVRIISKTSYEMTKLSYVVGILILMKGKVKG